MLSAITGEYFDDIGSSQKHNKTEFHSVLSAMISVCYFQRLIMYNLFPCYTKPIIHNILSYIFCGNVPGGVGETGFCHTLYSRGLLPPDTQ